MEVHNHSSLAPDPVTEPEKCLGIRISFMVISALGIALLLCAIIGLYTPSVYSFLKSSTEINSTPNTPDLLLLQHGSGLPIFR